MRKRGLCRHPVSVRLSVTFVDCIHMAEDIVKLLSLSGSLAQSFEFSDHQRRYPILRGPFSGGAKYTGVRKIAIFD